MSSHPVIAWFSGGVTSTVACKIALKNYANVIPVFIETGGHHSDMPRYIKDCEEWFGVKVTVLQDKRYEDHMDLCEKLKVINFISGAECSRTLKKKVRQKYEKTTQFSAQIFGFEHSKKEINRAIRFKEQYPESRPVFPLIDKELDKAACMSMVERAGIALPEMYKLGYSNNNCVGCVKGGKGYWNRVRGDFPKSFARMSQIERKIGRSCINGTFLDELDPEAGRHKEPPMPECDLFCELEFADLESPRLKDIISGKEKL